MEGEQDWFTKRTQMSTLAETTTDSNPFVRRWWWSTRRDTKWENSWEYLGELRKMLIIVLFVLRFDAKGCFPTAAVYEEAPTWQLLTDNQSRSSCKHVGGLLTSSWNGILFFSNEASWHNTGAASWYFLSFLSLQSSNFGIERLVQGNTLSHVIGFKPSNTSFI